MLVSICSWIIREWELQIWNWSSSVQSEIAPLFTISFQCLIFFFKSWQVYDWLAKWLIMSEYMDLRRPRNYRRSNVGLVLVIAIATLHTVVDGRCVPCLGHKPEILQIRWMQRLRNEPKHVNNVTTIIRACHAQMVKTFFSCHYVYLIIGQVSINAVFPFSRWSAIRNIFALTLICALLGCCWLLFWLKIASDMFVTWAIFCRLWHKLPKDPLILSC